MITTTCPTCNARYQLDAAFAGKTVRCKPCQQTFVVFEVIDALDVAPPTSTGIVPADSVRSAASPAAAPAPIPPPRLEERLAAAKRKAAARARQPKAARPKSGESIVAWVVIGAVALVAFVIIGVFAFNAMDETPVHAPVAKKRDGKKDADPGFRHNPANDEKIPIHKPMPPVFLPPTVIAAPPFQNGQSQIESQLTSADHRDAVHNTRCKTYEVELSPFRTYVIELKSGEFNAYLRLLDPSGAVIASDDDSGGNGNARIRYKPQQLGKHRVVATSTGDRVGQFSLIVREDSAASFATGHRLAIVGRKSDGEIFRTPLKLSGKDVVGIAWTPSGDAFFTLTDKGMLCRVAAEGFIEERRLPIDQKATCLALSAEGLVVTLPDREELWLVDPTSLDVKKRIRVHSLMRGLSAPSLKFALATCHFADNTEFGSVTYVDLATEETTPASHAICTSLGTLTSDGTRYYAKSKSQLCAYELVGKRLRPASQTAQDPLFANSLAVSPDGKLACIPFSRRAATDYVTPVFAVNNLGAPAFALRSRKDVGLVAFDSVGQFVYSWVHDKHLVVHSMTGNVLAEYSLGPSVAQTRHFAVHPRGSKLLVATDMMVWYVELDGLKSKVPPTTNPNATNTEKKQDIVGKTPPPKVAPLAAIAAPAFENGELKIEGLLTKTDPKDAVRNGPCNVHTVELSAGRTYVIDLKSKDFDAYLRLENPGGVTVASDDDGGDGLNSRIRYTPQQTGAYRVCATVLGSGTGRYTLTIRDTSIPGAKAP